MWKPTKEMMNASYAMISVLILSTVYYYSFPSIALNPNIVSFLLSALLVLYIYRVAKSYSVMNWIIIGVLAGLAILGKYEAAFLFLPALVFFLIHKDSRKQLWSSGFLLAVVVYFAIITPHIIWLFQNNFGPFYYGLDKTTPGTNVDKILDQMYSFFTATSKISN